MPLVIILVLIFVFAWPRSRNAIANGPLSPMWRSGATAMAPIAAPFHFAAQNQAITALKHNIMHLQHQLASANAGLQAKSKQVSNLKSQIAQLQAQAVIQRSKVKARSPVVAAASAGAGVGLTSAPGVVVAGNLAAGATPDMMRTAADWANMQPSNAAKLVQKLPVGYDARVMALMSPDAVGAILDALPTAFAAQLTQENPQLRR